MNPPPGDAVTGLQEAACFPERRKTQTDWFRTERRLLNVTFLSAPENTFNCLHKNTAFNPGQMTYRGVRTVLVFSSQAPDDGLVQCPPHLINVDSMFYVIFTFWIKRLKLDQKREERSGAEGITQLIKSLDWVTCSVYRRDIRSYYFSVTSVWEHL